MDGSFSQNNNQILTKTLDGVESLDELDRVQKQLMEKEFLISSLRTEIKKLEIKNKEFCVYQEAVLECEQRVEEAEGKLLKCSEKLRLKNQECEQLRSKIESLQRDKKMSSSNGNLQSEYSKISHELKNLKEIHKDCSYKLEKEQNLQVESRKRIESLENQIENLNQKVSLKDIELKEFYGNKGDKNRLSVNSNRDMSTSINMGSSRLSAQMISPKGRSNVVSSFRILATEESPSSSSIATESMNQDLALYSRENSELKLQINRLEEQLKHCMNKLESKQKSTKEDKETREIIENYESRLATMADRLTSMHKLELEKSKIEEENRSLLVSLQQVEAELQDSKTQIQILQKKIKEYERYKDVGLKSDVSIFINKNEQLQKHTNILEKTLKEKCEKIKELEEKYKTLHLTKQSFEEVLGRVAAFEEIMRKKSEELKTVERKLFAEEEKCLKFQKEYKKLELSMNDVKAEMAKTNRMVSQKMQKIEFQNLEIERLQKENAEKNEISQKLAKLETEFNKLEKKYESLLDESNELAMTVIILSAEIERRDQCGSISKEFMEEFIILKEKAKENEECSIRLEERVKRLEQLHKQVVEHSMTISEHLHASHKKWNHYDSAMEGLVQFLTISSKKSEENYEKMNENIDSWLQQQDKRLAELRETPF